MHSCSCILCEKTVFECNKKSICTHIINRFDNMLTDAFYLFFLFGGKYLPYPRLSLVVAEACDNSVSLGFRVMVVIITQP